MLQSENDGNDQETKQSSTIWTNNKNTINITNKSQEVSPFPAGEHEIAMKRRESMKNTRLE